MKIIALSLCILTLILLVRVVLFFQGEKVYKSGDVFKKEITLLSEPKNQFSYQIVRYQGIRIELPLYPRFHYGDTLLVLGTVEKDSFIGDDGKEVSLSVIKNPEVKIIPTKNPFIVSAAFIREHVWSVFSRTIPTNEAGLLYGIVFGGTQGFNDNLTQAFRNTGVFHVVAASGMNVTLVSGFLFALFQRFVKRKIAIFLSIAGIFYYALLAGFEPSIVRASVMASIAFTAAILGRQNQGFFALFLTGWLMIMLLPENAYNAGFLLSFSSTFGILLVKPFFDRFSIFQKTKVISDDIATTVSAQAGSLPFMGAFFSSYSYISIFVNTLVLWTIPFLMVLGGIAAFCAVFLPFLSFIPLYIALPLLWYFEKVILLFSNIPLFNLGEVPIIMWIGYYLILLSFILMIKRKK